MIVVSIKYLQAEGTMNESAIPTVTQALEVSRIMEFIVVISCLFLKSLYKYFQLTFKRLNSANIVPYCYYQDSAYVIC